MRFAKSRSTRSKLRTYFRSKQRDSLTKSGELIFFDYLTQHDDEIRQSSYLEYKFDVPKNTEELSSFLPGRSHYNDVDELLYAVGKSHNTNFIRTKVSKIFLVPLKVLEASDEGSRFTNITQEMYASQVNGNSNALTLLEEDDNMIEDDQMMTPKSSSFSSPTVDLPDGGPVEYADSECACRHCLPIRGDTIIGTKGHTADAPTIVHRLECPYAQQALNDAKSDAVNVDDVVGDPVKLVWSEAEPWEEEGGGSTPETFLVEIVVMAIDRKLLLADCSVIASKYSEILKTGSSSSAEHCSLEFLTRVSDLEELQLLMNKLGEVHSVMSVERRFGSELLE